ncbi:MAG: RsiV family protein [Treponema sp.]|nr:RsiV family protein [Treponema sp.]
MSKFIALLCIVGGILLVSCRSVPDPASDQPDLLADVADLLVQFPDTQADLLSRYYNETITATDYDHYVIIKQQMEYYSGGAHGLYGTEYQVFDRNGARFVTLQDLFSTDQQEALYKAVMESLRKRFELAEGQGLTAAGFFSDDLVLTKNFFLSGEGVGFHWNPYELAPYVFGEIEVVVPHESR